jgi:two-component system KDP operon response regulator KdpE
VRRYIWLLRQKFEADPANPRWIRTVRGYGYRMGTGTGRLAPLEEA